MPHRRCRPNRLHLRRFHRLRLSLPGLARPARPRREDAIYLYNQIVKDPASPAPIGDSAASRQSAGLELSTKAQAPTIDNIVFFSAETENLAESPLAVNGP